MDDLLREAIADAKAVRETALANAKIALEEAFTPRLKSMLSRKIESEMDAEEMEEKEEKEDEEEIREKEGYEMNQLVTKGLNGGNFDVLTEAQDRTVNLRDKGVAGMGGPTNQTGIKVAKDSICHIHSGILDPTKKMVLGNLHKAIKPMNQLKMLEDATVIYRISRAPERRIFYVDVGNLPKVTVVGFSYIQGSILPSNVVINCFIALTLFVFL